MNTSITNITASSMLQQMKEMESMAQGVNNRQSTEGENNFSDLFKNAINSVNEIQKTSSALKTGYELGDPNISLTQVMIAAQKSEISFQALLQVRNKLLMAYQEVMRMQI